MELIDIDALIAKEQTRCNFIATYLTPIIDRYKLIKGATGWLGIHMDSGNYLANISDIASHLYTFQSIDGHVYLAMMPYTDSSVKQIQAKLLLNGIQPLVVTKYSPCADMMILFDRNNILY